MQKVKFFGLFFAAIGFFVDNTLYAQRPLTETESYYLNLKDLIVANRCTEARTLALKKGDLTAAESVDQLCEYNRKGQLDKDNAEFIFSLLGWDVALYVSGVSYTRGDKGFPRDTELGIAMLKAASQKGNTGASLELGNIYLAGELVVQNKSEAFSYYMKCALVDDDKCQFAVGKLFFEGIGTTKSDRMAVAWLEKSANKGFAPAQFLLAVLQSEGIGTVQNKSAAFQNFMAAAKQGNQQAQIEVASSYALGDGVSRDDFRAHIWFLVARKNGATFDETTLRTFGKILRKGSVEAEAAANRCLNTSYSQCF